MPNANETVAEIAKEMKERVGFRAYYDGGKYHESIDECVVEVDSLHDYADRIKKAYGCEIAAKDAKIAELRKCLKEAVHNECNFCRTVHTDGTYGKCEHLRDNGQCDHLRNVHCIVHKWRKALEGIEEESEISDNLDDMTSDNPVDEVISRASIVEKFQSKAQMVFYAVRDALEKLITTETVLLCDIRPCRGFDYDGVLVREGNILLKYRSVYERYEFVADPYLFTLSEPEQITDYWYQHKLKENKRLIEEAERKAKAENDEEYATYLRLKEKFEGKETANE